MSHGLYITATDARSGKSAISLGVMEMLYRKIDKIAFFRPIISVETDSKHRDNDILLIATHFNLNIPYEKMYGLTDLEVNRLLSAGKKGEIFEIIFKKFNDLKETHDFVLIEGTDLASSAATYEFDINAGISKNLGCPVLLVTNAHQKDRENVLQSTKFALESLIAKRCQTIATIVNRTEAGEQEEILRLLKSAHPTRDQLVYAIPNIESLGRPTVGEVAEALDAEVIHGQEQLSRHVSTFTVAAMQLRNLVPRIRRGSLIITPGDRADVIVTCLAAFSSLSMGNISGLLLTGGLKPEEPIWKLVEGFPKMAPILFTHKNTFPTSVIVAGIHATIKPDDERKITQALAVFEKNIDQDQLCDKVITTQTTMVTPKMFEYGLVQKARVDKQHIVLPEGEEPRILQAAEILRRREVVDLTLLGRKQTIEERIGQLGLRLNGVHIVEPENSEQFENYVRTYFELRKHKGITLDNAYDVMGEVNFFGTMMVYQEHADGMVSGSVHSTAATIRPALQIIKTKPGFSVVSSVFFMCLPENVLVYGDCAVNPNPNAQQLAEIALSSAQTAKTFGVTPVVAMLSYSTGDSGTGTDVEIVREAARIAKEKAAQLYPDLQIEGPIQYDAAVDPAVARTKMPDSAVAGKATVFIFPDLNTGNNTYKAVQRSARAVAIGPVMQGLKRPVNDLSRGCTITDIVNTVAITAIQAQSA